MNSSEERIARLRKALEGAGVRVTHQRLEIIRALVSHPDHPSVAEVFRAAREAVPSLSLDTVYRTLRTLSGLGVIHPVGSSPERVRFDADSTPHHHFHCSVCGNVFDFQSPELDRIPVPDQALRIGIVGDTRLEVRGVCRGCADNRRKGGQ